MALPVIALVALLSPDALASWPDDVSIGGMTTQDGIEQLNTEALAEDYATVVRELGFSIATSAIPAPHTLGVRGFELTLDSGFVFLDVQERDGTPSPWGRASVDERPSGLQATPGLTVRKGLPLSLELGMTGRWVSLSRQGVFGGFVRAGLVEGWKPFPDVSLRMGYTAFLGGEDLELGVFDAGLTLGSTFSRGAAGGLRSAHITPYLDVSLLVVSATPLLTDAEVLQLGAVTYGRRSNNPDTLPAEGTIVMPRFSGGLELQLAHFVLRLSGGYALGATGNFAAALGFRY